MDTDQILKDLVDLSRKLGREDRGLAILGEGNTSARCDDGTFLVKASGSQLGTITAENFSRVRLEPVAELMARKHLSDEQVAKGLQAVLTESDQPKPSVETFMHAVCLTEGLARWVGHTHAISVNQILCSKMGATPFLNHLFPDAIVVCGKIPAVVPYVDPGLPLALVVRDEIRRYIVVHERPPKLLLLVNHGLVALGQNPKEVFNITLMADKWAKILLGTYALGGPSFLPHSEVRRIDTRLDEHYRRRQLGQQAEASSA